MRRVFFKLLCVGGVSCIMVVGGNVLSLVLCVVRGRGVAERVHTHACANESNICRQQV